MCLCSKINKIYSGKDLYHGRPMPYYAYGVKQPSQQAMGKKSATTAKKSKQNR